MKLKRGDKVKLLRDMDGNKGDTGKIDQEHDIEENVFWVMLDKDNFETHITEEAQFLEKLD